jgi:catalase
MAFESDQNPYTSSPLDTSDPDCSTQDLYDAFDREEYPTWRVRIQVLNPQEILDVGFHALDLTKHWPEAGFHYPKCAKTTEWRDVGKITLKQKPEDHFSEIEQLALSPSNLVPGVEPSEDPMLQARLFAYPDGKLYSR